MNCTLRQLCRLDVIALFVQRHHTHPVWGAMILGKSQYSNLKTKDVIVYKMYDNN